MTIAAIPTPKTALPLLDAAAPFLVAEAEAALPVPVTLAVAVADPVAPAGTLALFACVIETVLVMAPLRGVTLIDSPVAVTETVDPTDAPGAPEEIIAATPEG